MSNNTLTPGAIAAGTWLRNPATGEITRMNVGPADTGGRRIEADLWLQPGAAVGAPHRHPALVERFEVVEGSIGVILGSQRLTLNAGDPPVEVPAGVLHDWFNASDGVAHVHVTVEGNAGRFVSAIEALWSLGALGEATAKGMPGPLWMAAIGREYADVIQMASPPPAVQKIVFGVLAPLARLRGRDVLAPALHGPAGAAVIADPGEDGLADLLKQRVGTRAARGH